MKIPDNTKIQSIELRVKDLNSSLQFYSDLIGFKVIRRNNINALLSADGKDPYLIKLTEDKTALVRIKGTTGLYHIAFLFPDRKELAKVFLRLFRKKVKFQGFSDHLVSEAIYLADPDGNGIELYTDKPRDTWIWRNGEVLMDSLPLDLSLITGDYNDNEEWRGIHPDTFIGHIHLNVSDLRKAEEFYNDLLGMNISNYSYPGAMFFSAGGYHHHIAVNTWINNKKLSANDKSLGLISFSVKLNSDDYLNYLKEKISGTEYNIIAENENELMVKNSDGALINIIA